MTSPTKPAARVAMVVRNAYTHDTRVEKEARTLVAGGYDVTVVADAGPGLPDRERRGGATVIRVPRRARRLPGLRFIVHELALIRVLRQLRPDVLHAHDSNALVPVALAAISLRRPFVYDAHDLWLGRPRRERSRTYFAANQLYYRVVEGLLVPRASAVITVSQPIADHLERAYRLERVDLVPNFPEATPGSAHPSRDLRSLPGMEDVPADSPLILYLGGLMGGRGLEQLVDAVPYTSRGTLVLLGSGALAEPLRRRATDRGVEGRVRIVPPVPSEEVVAFAASASVGVSPIVPSCLNYRYSLPNKLFQYMAAATPVIASDFPQVRSIVDDAGCGTVVDTTQPRAIAAAIDRLLADPALAAEMGRRGRTAIEDRYNWSAAGSALLDVYARVSGRTRSAG